ncbi:MAG: gliding motility-associated C-terminal domain-containing protein, partial [Bacteroidia bacterium]
MMKKLLLSIAVLFIGLTNALATHNRAGEITYEYIGDALHPYKYRVTVTTYTKFVIGSTNTDRCEETIYFGDGDSCVAPRRNGPSFSCPSSADGVMIPTAVDTRLNIYWCEHNYAGPGNYIITMEDPNRNSGICNIVDSENKSFFLRSELVISPFLAPNNSPTLLNPPIDDACLGVCFEHNPGAYDVDGDSLYYSLSTCYANGLPLAPLAWEYPPNMGPGSIDSRTGDLVWCVPDKICQYNVAILIKEYRLVPGTHVRYYIGSVLRDMQITVGTCNNTPPTIQNLNDTCVIAGNNLNFTVSATDAEPNPLVLSATGGPFLTTPFATFSTTSGMGVASGIFNWTPGCNQVQLLPYLVTFKARDSDLSVPLATYESMFIKVIAPPPTGLTAVPSGSSIILDWNHPMCDTLGSNQLIKYLVYRKNNCDPWQPGPCETGVPAYTGYTLIGTTAYNDTDFTDNNGGAGLTNGVDYSYIVVAVYADGSQSIASQNVCAKLVRDVPIITNVSVLTTSATTGSIWTHWLKPIGSSTNLDTIINPPPYEYRLMRASGFSPPASAFSLEATYTYGSYSALTDTGFISTNLNTVSGPYTYKVDFYSNGIYKGSTQTASSVFLSSVPGDKVVNLSWNQFVPWNNYEYYIWKETSPGSGIFTQLDSTTSKTYVDTGLVNEVQYCYKILSKGEYSDTTLIRPLYNWSEIKCETPVDLIPPCQPKFDVVTDCDILQNTITWTNPNTYCCDDAVQINIYFSPTTDDPLQLIYSTTTMSDSSYTLPVYLYEHTVPSVAGCYAVTAVDSALHPNESPIINKICIDNCQEYELPNVFTPNADGKNDLFTPMPGYRNVKDVEIHIYDRWGLEMFQTTDKDVKWDGTNASSGTKCTDGVYFYVCTVNEIRISGIRPRVIKGFVQIIRE